MDQVLGIPNLRAGETPGARPPSGGRCGYFDSCRAESDPRRVLPAFAKSSARLLGSEELEILAAHRRHVILPAAHRGSARGSQDKAFYSRESNINALPRLNYRGRSRGA